MLMLTTTRWTVLLLTLGMLTVACLTFGWQVQEPTHEQLALIDAAGLDFAERRVTEVHERAAPSVVNITTQLLRRSFFMEVYPEEGAGSGFVIDTSGHILTNYHVIRRANSIEVAFGDETIVPARVVGADPWNDIAILKVDAPAELLVPLELGSSASLKVGQRAIAIGNPFGQFGRTLTTGVVSALERSLQGGDGREIRGLIQTDAAINRGNSGGPLLDSSGRVIGMNTAIFSPTGASAGIGFAIPADTLRRVMPDLFQYGRYRHPTLGVHSAHRISPALAEALNLPARHGLLLVQLQANGPLAQAGARGANQEVILGNRRYFIGGDILSAVDDVPVTSLENLQALLEEKYQVGDDVTVTIIREGQRHDLQLRLAEEPAQAW